MKAKYVTTCSGCATDVTLRTGPGTATVRVPSNGRRGDGHVPAHDVTADVTVEDHNFLTWDCPGCGYADSFDPVHEG